MAIKCKTNGHWLAFNEWMWETNRLQQIESTCAAASSERKLEKWRSNGTLVSGGNATLLLVLYAFVALVVLYFIWKSNYITCNNAIVLAIATAWGRHKPSDRHVNEQSLVRHRLIVCHFNVSTINCAKQWLLSHRLKTGNRFIKEPINGMLCVKDSQARARMW